MSYDARSGAGSTPPSSRVDFFLLDFLGLQLMLEQNALYQYIDVVLFLFLILWMNLLLPDYLWYAHPCFA